MGYSDKEQGINNCEKCNCSSFLHGYPELIQSDNKKNSLTKF